jgi:uncharacterized protein
MTELVSVFILGLLSSAHCLGMCGGFVVTIGATRQPIGPLALRQLVYSFGRVTTYAFMGAIAGFSGLYLSRFDSTLVTMQQVFSIVAGVMMLAIGASVLGLFRLPVLKSLGVGSLFAPLFQQLLSAKGTHGFFLAGIANGFLPCGLVYAFVAKAVASGSMVDGLSIMIAFGLGTVPAMVAMGCSGQLIGHAARHRILQVAACLVIVAGVVTIVRAIPSVTPCEDCAEDVALVVTGV